MISVIIPAFNATLTIRKCLVALAAQTFQPKEIIIVDDGSKDNLESEISRLRIDLKMKNLVLLKQNHKGVSEARNLGVKKSCGEILVFLDSDCVPDKNWLKKINEAFSNPQVGAVGGGYSSGIDNSFWQRFSCEELFFRRRKRIKIVKTLLSNNMACRKDYFLQAGGFPKKYPVCEDMYLSYQISHNHKIIWLQNNGVKHHFKYNLKDFLKHQYFFGKESTRFFLDNPEILFSSNHQGRQLHLAIIFSSLSIISLLAAIILKSTLFLEATAILLLIHFIIYINFIFYLRRKTFSIFDIIKAYFVSFIRDLIAALSFLAGMALYIKR